jgi:uncharacterized membrane protein
MKRKYDLFTWLGIAVYVLVFSTICFLKYRAFAYHDFDLAAYSQIPWNLLHGGSLYCSLIGLDFLGQHAHFILFLITPLYSVFPHPLTLLFLQTIVLGLTAWPLYLIAKELLDDRLGFLVAVMYLIYFPLAFTNLFEFHVTVFATLFLTLMYFFFYKNNYLWFTFFMVLSLFCQENIPFVVFTLGLYAIFIKKDKKFILTPILLSLFWIFICFYLVIPYFNQGQMRLMDFYSHLGSNLPEIAFSPVLKPLKVLVYIFRPVNLMYLLLLFVPLTFVPFLGFEFIAVLSPFLLQHLLSSRFTDQSLTYHYTAEMLPFIFLALIYGLKKMGRLNMLSPFFSLMLLVFALFYAIYLGPLVQLAENHDTLKVERLDYERINLIRRIPKDSGVIASFDFLSRLSHRKYLFPFINIIKGLYPYSSREFFVPPSVDYALIDFEDALTRFLVKDHKYPISLNARAFVDDPEWGVMEVVDSLVLMKRGEKGRGPLFKILQKEPEATDAIMATIDNAIGLQSCQFKDEYPRDFRVVFYWHCLKTTHKDINVYFDIIDSRGKVVYILPKLICYGIYPVPQWKKGEIIEEKRMIVIPRDLPKGIYEVKVRFYDADSGAGLEIAMIRMGILDIDGRMKLGKIIVR